MVESFRPVIGGVNHGADCECLVIELKAGWACRFKKKGATSAFARDARWQRQRQRHRRRRGRLREPLQACGGLHAQAGSEDDQRLIFARLPEDCWS